MSYVWPGEVASSITGRSALM